MYTTCGDMERCNKGGIETAHRAWQPVTDLADLAELLVSIWSSRPDRLRRLMMYEVGGCPLCILDDKDAFADYLIDSVCCFEQAEPVASWVKRHKKPLSQEKRVCDKHCKGADEAWLLLNPDFAITVGDTSIPVGHAAFAFKRPPSLGWPQSSPWVCGSSNGVNPWWVEDQLYPRAAQLLGPALYGWVAASHPLDAVKDGGPLFPAEYTHAKRFRVDRGNWLEALVVADDMSHENYSLAGNNCADVTRRALEAYGVDIPWVLEGVTPLIWFDRCPGETISLRAERKRRPRKPRRKPPRARASVAASAAPEEAAPAAATVRPETSVEGPPVALGVPSPRRRYVFADGRGDAAHLHLGCPVVRDAIEDLVCVPDGRADLPDCGHCLRAFPDRVAVLFEVRNPLGSGLTVYEDRLELRNPLKREIVAAGDVVETACFELLGGRREVTIVVPEDELAVVVGDQEAADALLGAVDRAVALSASA